MTRYLNKHTGDVVTVSGVNDKRLAADDHYEKVTGEASKKAAAPSAQSSKSTKPEPSTSED